MKEALAMLEGWQQRIEELCNDQSWRFQKLGHWLRVNGAEGRVDPEKGWLILRVRLQDEEALEYFVEGLYGYRVDREGEQYVVSSNCKHEAHIGFILELNGIKTAELENFDGTGPVEVSGEYVLLPDWMLATGQIEDWPKGNFISIDPLKVLDRLLG